MDGQHASNRSFTIRSNIIILPMRYTPSFSPYFNKFYSNLLSFLARQVATLPTLKREIRLKVCD